ncbi:MAG: hypothetical protein M3345_06870, partial [Actinomycetota bacterium]|nr:hypothetical protein [Actinomycetota bacterium]
AQIFAAAATALAADRRVALVASAHSSAALTIGAPLGLREEAIGFDRMLIETLATDVGALARVAPDAWSAVGSCGLAPLVALARCMEGVSFEVLEHRCPYGVGYTVARSL